MKKANKFLVTGSIALIFSLTGCASYVKVRLLKPSEFSLGPVKKLAVSNFNFTGNVYYNEDNSLESLAVGALVNTIMGKQVVNTNNSYSGSQASQIFTQKLFANGHYKIIDKVNQINENNLSQIELSSLRNSLGAEAIIAGSGIYSVTDSGRWTDDVSYKNGVKITNKKYDINRRINTSLSYKVINTLNGEIIAAKTNSRTDSEDRSGVDQDSARNSLRDWRGIITDQLEELSDQSIKQIAPYYVFEDREVKEGKSYLMKQGLQYAKKDLWQQAKANWETVLENKQVLTGDAKEDAIFATYNLGIYNEINGDFNKAQELFSQCYKQSSKSEYIDAQNRVRMRQFEVQRLKNQGSLEINN